MTRLLAAILTGLAALPASPVWAQQQSVEVIELQYRSVDDVIPVLRPLLAPGGALSGVQGKLVVRTTPANLLELRKVLDAIDTVPKRLVISVRQEASAVRSDLDAEVSARVGSGPDSVRARVQGTRSDRTGRGSQSVQVVEGNAAFIRIGVSVPVRSRQTAVGPGGVTTRTDTIEYRNVDTGFYAQPRVNGDQVTVQLATRRDSVSEARGGAFRIDRVESMVSGRLGEWIEVAGVSQDEVRDEAGTIYYRSSSGADRRSTFIKVERLP